jgi:poly(hydroxyalkanoate) depolymerase family esterase
VRSHGTPYPYILYTPTTYTRDTPAPLVVVLHGCQTTADEQMHSSLYNPVAEREGFVVLYVEADKVGRAQPGPAANCWKFAYPPAYFRDNADGAAIADVTRAIMAQRTIDPERVYVAGISGGGLMASAVGATPTASASRPAPASPSRRARCSRSSRWDRAPASCRAW